MRSGLIRSEGVFGIGTVILRGGGVVLLIRGRLKLDQILVGGVKSSSLTERDD